MTGARITGLARQHPLALEKAAARLTVAGRHEATHEPLAGLANQCPSENDRPVKASPAGGLRPALTALPR